MLPRVTQFTFQNYKTAPPKIKSYVAIYPPIGTHMRLPHVVICEALTGLF